MKIEINAKVFEELAGVAAQAISSKPMRPEYECVHIAAHADGGIPLMTVMARDTGIAIRKATDNLQVMEEGEALIPAKTLLNFLKLMKGDVTLTVDDDFKANIKCGSKRASIACMDASDFPADFDPMDGEMTVEMDSAAFSRCVENTAHCIGKDQGRMVLTGVHFAFGGENGECEAVGLDGFRMAVAQEKAETNDTFDALIPFEMARLISKVTSGENVSFRFGKGRVIVDDYTTTVEASLLSGEYIEYRKLIFRDGAMRVKVQISAMLEAVKLAMISADSDRKKLILLNFDGEDSMRVSARADKCDAVTDVACEITGGMKDGSREIAFNGDYVMEALKASENYGEDATLILNAPGTPMAVIPVERNDYYQLVLPVRRM